MSATIRFTNPNLCALGEHIAHAAGLGLPLVEPGGQAGRPGALVVGLGPSVRRRAVLRRMRGLARAGWAVFAIKEAARFLAESGIPAEFAVNMDPGAQEVARTPVLPAGVHCVASSCHPALFAHLLQAGATVAVFHSACGWPGEVELYRRLFGRADVMVGGYTVVNRAVSLARYMGFPRLVLAGADFGWRAETGCYAAGVAAAPADPCTMTDHGRVDGRPWLTRPDLMASAVHVARLVKAGAVTVLGDSLAAGLARHDDAFLDRVCRPA